MKNSRKIPGFPVERAAYKEGFKGNHGFPL